MAKNVLFIMCDQLRADYLGCTGHPHVRTPVIDALARRGVLFRNAYAQSPICGPSRMSAYTGRYVRSHGSTQNGVPLRIGEPTLGDHLREIGVRSVLVGKTHMVADTAGMKRLGVDPESYEGVLASQCGFEPVERDDGLHPDGPYDPDPAYDAALRKAGFDSANPWEHFANSGAAPDGALQNGWLLTHADKPARVSDEMSETPYMTRRAMDFIRAAKADGQPWCLHLSYIKPHWPYIAPAPWHALYGAKDVVPPVKTEAERNAPHPVFGAFMQERYSQCFADDALREKVIPAYMGLVSQIDASLGELFAFLDEQGLSDETLIVFTSDHGDYLGDHWLGEKYLFHDPSVKVPLIVYDPSPAADATRGTVRHELVELIDLAPTFLDYFGGAPKPHVLEGRSLMPLLHDAGPRPWRTYAVSEYDYAPDIVRLRLGMPVRDCRLTMVTDNRLKYVRVEGFRPMIYDLAADPQELVDRGDHPDMVARAAALAAALDAWAFDTHPRITVPDAFFQADDGTALIFDPNLAPGLLIGYRDEADLAAEIAKRDAWRAAQKERSS